MPKLSVTRTSRVLSGLLLPVAAAGLFAWKSFAQTTERPKFRLAEIKLNPGCGGRRGGGGEQSSGRFALNCMPLRILIRTAYATFANGPQVNPRQVDVLGGPAWLDTELYDVNGIAEGTPALDQMAGPMLQSLLEERFHVKVHKETRQLPVYSLTAMPGGAKLQVSAEGSCVPLELNRPASRPGLGQTQKPFCGAMTLQNSGPNLVAKGTGVTMAEFAGRMLAGVGRPVIDKTGLNGKFDITLQYLGAGAPDSLASIFSAVQQQLGLALTPENGPVEVLVVDSAERPAAN